MATGTFVAMGTVTTSGNASSVTFSNLSGYKDYVLIFDKLYTNSAGENVYLELNGDTNTSNYHLLTAWGIGSTTAYGSTQRSDAASIIVGYNNGPTSTKAMTGVLQFVDAGATDKNKTILMRFGNPQDSRVGMTSTRWRNSSNAISSIKLKAETTYFLNGTTFSLFGIAGEL